MILSAVANSVAMCTANSQCVVVLWWLWALVFCILFLIFIRFGHWCWQYIGAHLVSSWHSLWREFFWPRVSGVATPPWERRWRFAGWRFWVPSKLTASAFAIVLTTVLFAAGFYWGLLSVFVWLLAFSLLRRAAKKQQHLFLEQLPDALQSLADALRAGFSIPQAINFIAGELPLPVGLLFQALARSSTLGIRFSEALTNTSNNLAIKEWADIAEVLSVEEQAGGSIASIILEQAKALRDRLSAEQEIKALTAAGRTSGLIIALLVPAILAFFLFVSPSYLAILFQTFFGRLCLASALILEVVGFLWIRRITRVYF